MSGRVRVSAWVAWVAMIASTAGCLRADRTCADATDCLANEVCAIEGFCVLATLTPDEGDAGEGDAGEGEGDAAPGPDVGGDAGACAPGEALCNGACCAQTRDGGVLTCAPEVAACEYAVEGGVLSCAPGASGCSYRCDDGFVACEGARQGCCPERPAPIAPDVTLSSDAKVGFRGNDVELVVDALGTAHALYSFAGEPNGDLSGLRHRVFDGDRWRDEVVVDPTLGAARGISAELDRGGTLHTIWTRDFTGQVGIEQGTFYSTRDPSGRWSPALSLTGDRASAGGSLVVDTDGVAHVLLSKANSASGVSQYETLSLIHI